MNTKNVLNSQLKLKHILLLILFVVAWESLQTAMMISGYNANRANVSDLKTLVEVNQRHMFDSFTERPTFAQLDMSLDERTNAIYQEVAMKQTGKPYDMMDNGELPKEVKQAVSDYNKIADNAIKNVDKLESNIAKLSKADKEKLAKMCEENFEANVAHITMFGTPLPGC